VVAADFTPGEADQLRRSMAAWKRRGGVGHFEEKLITGMRRNGYEEQFARQIVDQIRGFSEYGFPEAHAASFAVLAYVSAWLKYHHPAAFTAALLNSQPMGFYAPAQLLRDARAHGVEVLPVDVQRSDADSTLEPGQAGAAALRLGLAPLRGLPTAVQQRIVAARCEGPFSTRRELGGAPHWRATTWSAWPGRARWQASRPPPPGLLARRRLCSAAADGAEARGEVTCRCCAHPPRPRTCSPTTATWASRWGAPAGALPWRALCRVRTVEAGALEQLPDGAAVSVADLVVTRQRPQTSSGVTFVTLEDETGQVNVIVWRQVGSAATARWSSHG
jgi:error-prone DNA polymerase